MSSEKGWRFRSPTKLILENGAAKDIGAQLKRLNIGNVLIITDAVIQKVGILDKVLAPITAAGIPHTVYTDVLPEPPVENCAAAFKIFAASGCNGIIGLGGGSALDVAKAVAMLAANGGKFEDYVGIDRVPKRSEALILMPTTSGTGSETSVVSILMVEGSKMAVLDENIMANIALVDPLLTLSVPREITAATGLDAFCHHMEAFLSVNASPIADLITLEGIRIVTRYLRKAYGNGDDFEARYWLSYASAMGGYVMNLADGAAANHGFAFGLGAKFHVGHGLANAVMLQHVLPVVGVAELEKVGRMGKAMGVEMQGLSDREALDATVDAVRQLVQDVGCDIPLTSFGASVNDLDGLVEETMSQKRVMGHSTYRLTAEEVRLIFAKALEEKSG